MVSLHVFYTSIVVMLHVLLILGVPPEQLSAAEEALSNSEWSDDMYFTALQYSYMDEEYDRILKGQ